jgi:hypothetical protein
MAKKQLPTEPTDEPVDVRTAGLDNKYMKLVDRIQELKLARDEAEAGIKELKSQIMELQAVTGYKTVLTPDWRVTLTSGTNVTISKEKLLEQGVSVKIIEKATRKTAYETLTITANK